MAKKTGLGKGLDALFGADNIEENIEELIKNKEVTLKNPSFIPGIVKSDKNQSEFTLTLDEYLQRTVSTFLFLQYNTLAYFPIGFNHQLTYRSVCLLTTSLNNVLYLHKKGCINRIPHYTVFIFHFIR